jgi:hypothetical protein
MCVGFELLILFAQLPIVFLGDHQPSRQLRAFLLVLSGVIDSGEHPQIIP